MKKNEEAANKKRPKMTAAQLRVQKGQSDRLTISILCSEILSCEILSLTSYTHVSSLRSPLLTLTQTSPNSNSPIL